MKSLKKYISAIILVLALVCPAYANNAITLDNSDELIKTDEAYFLPVRLVFEKFGAEVNWNDDRSIDISFGGSEYKLYSDSDKIEKDGIGDKINVPVRIFNDRAYICLCAMEKFGEFSLSLDKETDSAEITLL